MRRRLTGWTRLPRPARGEVVQHPDGPEFEVIDADPRRIKRMRVRLPGAY